LRLAGPGSGTHVHVKQGSSDREAALITADAERIEARMPADATPGDSELVVTRDGQSSRPYAIRVAPAAFGIFARNEKGWGPGEIFNTGTHGEIPNTLAAPAPAGPRRC